MQIILASHGGMAEGMYDTLCMLMGKQKNVHYICAYVDDLPFEDTCADLLNVYPEEPICILCDLFGGSVYQSAIRYGNERIHVFGSINLALLLELVYKDDLDDAMCEKLLHDARNHMTYHQQKQDYIEDFF